MGEGLSPAEAARRFAAEGPNDFGPTLSQPARSAARVIDGLVVRRKTLRMPDVPCIKSLTAVSTLGELVERDRTHDCAGFGKHAVCVRVVAVADLPTIFGHFRIVAF